MINNKYNIKTTYKGCFNLFYSCLSIEFCKFKLINVYYSTLAETKLVVHQEKESKELNWNMDYFISRWGVNWDNKITVNLKSKNDGFNKWNSQNNRWPIFKVQLPYVLINKKGNHSQISSKYDLYVDYLLIETLKKYY